MLIRRIRSNRSKLQRAGKPKARLQEMARCLNFSCAPAAAVAIRSYPGTALTSVVLAVNRCTPAVFTDLLAPKAARSRRAVEEGMEWREFASRALCRPVKLFSVRSSTVKSVGRFLSRSLPCKLLEIAISARNGGLLCHLHPLS